VFDLVVGDDTDRQAKQRMDGLPANVERGNPRRRTNDHLLRRVPIEVVEQRRLACTSTPRNEYVLARGLDRREYGRLLWRELWRVFWVHESPNLPPGARSGRRRAQPA